MSEANILKYYIPFHSSYASFVSTVTDIQNVILRTLFEHFYDGCTVHNKSCGVLALNESDLLKICHLQDVANVVWHAIRMHIML